MTIALVGAVALLVAFGAALVVAVRRLRDAELDRRLLRAFLEHTPDQVYFKDRESRFLRVSAVQARRLGFAGAEEAVGKTDFDAFADDHALKAFEDEQRIIRTGRALHELEELEVFPDGREAWVSTDKTPLRDARGRIVGTFGVSRDVTTRKRAEEALRESDERWRTLLASLQELVALVGPDDRVLYASASVERWLGEAADTLVGRKLAEASHPDDVPSLERAFADVRPGRPLSLVHRLAHADGSWHTFESTLVCLRDDPVVGAVLVAGRDVTERVALEEERKRLELERRVSHRLEAVGQLAAGIAHEINTPLQFVGDSVAFLRETVDELLELIDAYGRLLPNADETVRAAVEQADLDYLRERIPVAFERTADGIDRVREIVLAIKRFSHPESSTTAPADLNEAIATTLTVCHGETKHVADVVLDLGDLPPVACNLGELNQVFLNLVVNAAQAIEEKLAGRGGRGEIRISTRREEDAVVVEIADDGPGIPPELLDRIYEPFFTTKPVGKGSGQGLALARTIVGRHGGSLECASEPGAGARFTIRLPLGAPRPVLASQAA